MAKTIVIKYEDKEYTLEFTRATVAKLEDNGFSIKDVSEKPASMLPVLFAGAFLAHHRFVKSDVIEDILKRIPNKEELFIKLAEMYQEPIEALLNDPEEDGESKNASWGASW